MLLEKLAKLIHFLIIVATIYFVFPFFLPFIFALILVVLFEPIVLFLKRKFPINRITSVIVVFTLFFSMVFSFIYFLLSKLLKEGMVLLKQLPSYIEKVSTNEKFSNDFYGKFSFISQDYIKETLSKFVDNTTSFLTTYAGGVIDVIKDFPVYFIAFIVFIVAVYIIAIELPLLKDSFLKYFEKGQSQNKIEIVLDKLKSAVIGFLRAQIILSTLTFIMAVIGLLILDMNYIFVSSFVIVLVDLLPIFGTGMVLVPWAIYSLIVGNVTHFVGLIILFIVMTIIRRMVEPKLLADTLGLKPLITLISLYVGFELMGILGMVIGPAIIIIIKALEDADLLKLRIKL